MPPGVAPIARQKARMRTLAGAVSHVACGGRKKKERVEKNPPQGRKNAVPKLLSISMDGAPIDSAQLRGFLSAGFNVLGTPS